MQPRGNARVVVYVGEIALAGDAVVEGPGIQPEFGSLAFQLLPVKVAAVAKQGVAHGLESILLSGTIGRLCRLACILVKPQRQITHQPANLAGIDVIPFQKRERALRKNACRTGTGSL